MEIQGILFWERVGYLHRIVCGVSVVVISGNFVWGEICGCLGYCVW